jgi:hypothetical protein
MLVILHFHPSVETSPRLLEIPSLSLLRLSPSLDDPLINHRHRDPGLRGERELGGFRALFVQHV